MSVIQWLFDFSSATTEPPTSSQIRFDSAIYPAVAHVWIRNLTSDGIDIYRGLLSLRAGTRLYVQDKNDHTLFAEFFIQANGIDKTSYVDFAVAFVQGSGAALLNNQAVVLVAATDAAGPDPPPAPGELLVTLTEAKAHLEIIGTDADADISLKLAAAQQAMLNYLRTANYWKPITDAYTAATVPAVVKICILLTLGNLDRFRGDESAADAAAFDAAMDFTPEIRSLLRQLRDPVLQ